jgi:hypothetical protein
MRHAYAQGVARAFRKFAVDAGAVSRIAQATGKPSNALHYAELAGLGLLTPKVIDDLTDEHTSTKDRLLSGAELAGLATLAIPTVHHLMHA